MYKKLTVKWKIWDMDKNVPSHISNEIHQLLDSICEPFETLKDPPSAVLIELLLEDYSVERTIAIRRWLRNNTQLGSGTIRKWSVDHYGIDSDTETVECVVELRPHMNDRRIRIRHYKVNGYSFIEIELDMTMRPSSVLANHALKNLKEYGWYENIDQLARGFFSSRLSVECIEIDLEELLPIS